MKVLYVTTVGSTMGFFKAFINQLLQNGNTVDIATNENESKVPAEYGEWNCKTHHIDASRLPFSKSNAKAYKQLKEVINDGEYDIVHCHTPVAAMLTRLAARKARKKGTRVIYTAHGFHFFKGAPIKNWLIYFPVEWLCSFFTDTLITINTEDFEFAKKHLHAKRTEYVHGVGIDTEKFKNIEVDREKKREELGIPKDSFAVLSVGELNDNKNHETILRAIAKIDRKDIVYVICGQGNKKEYLENLAKELGMEERLILAGYRKDIAEIYKCCDVFAFPSKREGLPVSVMEAMASGLPCVVSNIRGNADLINDEENGFLCSPLNVLDFADRIAVVAENKDLRNNFIKHGNVLITPFSFAEVKTEMMKIYNL